MREKRLDKGHLADEPGPSAKFRKTEGDRSSEAPMDREPSPTENVEDPMHGSVAPEMAMDTGEGSRPGELEKRHVEEVDAGEESGSEQPTKRLRVELIEILLQSVEKAMAAKLKKEVNFKQLSETARVLLILSNRISRRPYNTKNQQTIQKFKKKTKFQKFQKFQKFKKSKKTKNQKKTKIIFAKKLKNSKFSNFRIGACLFYFLNFRIFEISNFRVSFPFFVFSNFRVFFDVFEFSNF